MPGKRNSLRLIVAALILAPILLVLWVGVFSHDYNLWRMERSYAAIQHPSGTARVAFKKELGLLMGNGNHTDYFVGELRSYTCSEEKIYSYYANESLRNPMTGKPVGVRIEFSNYFLRGEEFPSTLGRLWGPEDEVNDHLRGKFYL